MELLLRLRFQHATVWALLLLKFSLPALGFAAAAPYHTLIVPIRDFATAAVRAYPCPQKQHDLPPPISLRNLHCPQRVSQLQLPLALSPRRGVNPQKSCSRPHPITQMSRMFAVGAAAPGTTWQANPTLPCRGRTPSARLILPEMCCSL